MGWAARRTETLAAGSGTPGSGGRTALYPAGAVVAAALLAYANATANGFTFDDTELVVGNPWLRDPSLLGKVFASDYWGFIPGYASNFYRPLVHAAWTALFQVSGLRAWPFHLVNVLLHAANSLLVFLFVDRFLAATASGSAGSLDGPGRSRIPALAAGLLFAFHPIHTEAVAWVSGLPELAFTLLVLVLLTRGLPPGRKGAAAAATTGLCFLAALLFKETAATLLPLMIALDLLLERSGGAPRPFARYAPLAAALAVYAAIRFAVMGGLGRMPLLAPYGAMEPSAYAANALRFFSLYLEKLLVPFPLNAVHHFSPLRSLAEGTALAGAGVVAASGALVLATARRAPRLCFALLLVLVPLLPVLLVPAFSPTPFGERYLYLPSVGLSLAVALLVERVDTRWRRFAAPAAAAFGLLLAAFLSATVARNGVWKDDLSLFSDAVARSPESEIANRSLGRALMEAGRDDEAVARLRAALESNPSSPRTRFHLARALLKLGRASAAVSELERVLAASPGLEVMAVLAEAYGEAGRFDDAVALRRQMVALRPESAPDRNLLGIDLGRAGRYDDAAEQFELAVRLDPGEPAFRRNLERAAKGAGR